MSQLMVEVATYIIAVAAVVYVITPAVKAWRQWLYRVEWMNRLDGQVNEMEARRNVYSVNKLRREAK